MSTVDIIGVEGTRTGSVELPDAIFDAQANIALMHQVVIAQLAAARQGTHKVKTRGEVRGGGKKPYKQKGTGRARQGSAVHRRRDRSRPGTARLLPAHPQEDEGRRTARRPLRPGA